MNPGKIVSSVVMHSAIMVKQLFHALQIAHQFAPTMSVMDLRHPIPAMTIAVFVVMGFAVGPKHHNRVPEIVVT